MQSITAEINQLWGSSFFPKSSKRDVDFANLEKNLEDILSLRDNCIWISCVKNTLLPRERILVIGNQYVMNNDDKSCGERERFSPNESQDYEWKLLYDSLKHENRQHISKMTS